MYKIFIPSKKLLLIICRYNGTTVLNFVIHLVLQLSGLTFDFYWANSLTSQQKMVLFVYHIRSLCKRDLFILQYPSPIHR